MTDKQSKQVVLIVDDESEIREILSIHVHSCGYDVLEAEDGQRGIEVVRENPVDVVISDIMMPRMSGMMFLRAMRDEGYDLPFIFVTAYPSKEATVEALRLGAFDFLEKPFETSDITKLVHEAMRVSEFSRRQQQGNSSNVNSDQTKDATAKIMSMGAIRYGTGIKDGVADSGEQSRLQELFVTESIAQLVFCEASVKGLSDVDSRTWELGYMFRVMQGLKAASEAIGLERIRRFTSDLEGCFTLYRVRPSELDDSAVNVLTNAVTELRTLITTVGTESKSEELSEAEKEVKGLLNRLNGIGGRTG